jgi:hypothetical protein
MATKDELQAQLDALDKQDEQLKTSREKTKSPFEKTKTYNWTKGAIAAIVIFLAVIGTLGSMRWAIFYNFDMDSFTKFISAYQGIFIALTGSVGVGGIVKNVLKGKNIRNSNGKEGETESAPIEDSYSMANTSYKATHAPVYKSDEEKGV